MPRYKTETRPGLVALYDIRSVNGAGQFLQLRSPHGASVPVITRRITNAQSTAEGNGSRKTVMAIIYNAINSHIKMLETIVTTIHYTQVHLVKTTIMFGKHKHATCQHSSSSNCNGIGGHITEMSRPTEAWARSPGYVDPVEKSSHTMITLNNIVALHDTILTYVRVKNTLRHCMVPHPLSCRDIFDRETCHFPTWRVPHYGEFSRSESNSMDEGRGSRAIRMGKLGPCRFEMGKRQTS